MGGWKDGWMGGWVDDVEQVNVVNSTDYLFSSSSPCARKDKAFIK